ncbi:MAG: hypothetical protein LBH50_02305 [Spirochaetaceae bacterium]|jgi:hypothetical protein|nr:hypothetical protein [Spirochaetaceae bacterium]
MKAILRRHTRQWGARIALVVCAILFIAAGVARGDAAALWRKAVFVCMECAGIA